MFRFSFNQPAWLRKYLVSRIAPSVFEKKMCDPIIDMLKLIEESGIFNTNYNIYFTCNIEVKNLWVWSFAFLQWIFQNLQMNILLKWQFARKTFLHHFPEIKTYLYYFIYIIHILFPPYSVQNTKYIMQFIIISPQAFYSYINPNFFISYCN